ncbi:MAG TPA: DNA-binding protein [Lachnospiraceae bacterium]|nr:DNA-binding protein [Lachnospiraceae bacterium]
MAKEKIVKETIIAKGTEISVLSSTESDDYISLTDMAKYKNSTAPKDVVKNWLRLRGTIEFLGLWETLNNDNFNRVEFDSFKISSGENAFTLSPQQWIKLTNAIGITSKSGRYGGGTYAHKDIAMEFASWLSPEFKLYIIKEYQRLKNDESHKLALDWSVKRFISKTNYKLHTDAIKENLIPEDLPKEKQGFVYADEADILNMALFGKTSKQWREENPTLKGNIRDFASIEQLIVLNNLESISSLLIEQGLSQYQRLTELRKMALKQINALINNKSISELNNMDSQIKLP